MQKSAIDSKVAASPPPEMQEVRETSGKKMIRDAISLNR